MTGLKYADYINDRAVVDALRPLSNPGWPKIPRGWKPGDDWPEGDEWAHDEVLFIRTHQAFEIWFAVIVHELASVVRETEHLARRNNFTFDRVTLKERNEQKDSKLIIGYRRSWPKTVRVIDAAIRTDRNTKGALAQLWVPCSQSGSTKFQSRFGETEEFDHYLERASHRLRRAAAILRYTVGFFDLLATMTPVDFLTFRDRLSPASGFGSAQFREIEYLLGLIELNEAKQSAADPKITPFNIVHEKWGLDRIEKRAKGRSLRDIVYGILSAAFKAARDKPKPKKLPAMNNKTIDEWLSQCLANTIRDQYRGLSEATLDSEGVEKMEKFINDISLAIAQSEVMAATLLEALLPKSYFGGFLQSCLEVDDALLFWRDRHIRFVETMIGSRQGTGGGGVGYLRKTVKEVPGHYYSHAFPCLWYARSFVQRTPFRDRAGGESRT